MPSSKLMWIHALLALATMGTASDGHAQTADSPQGLLVLWQAALERGDHAAHLACLHEGARQVPEYGTAEAMAFWAEELRELAREGFDGRFEIAVVPEGDERFPTGAVRAHPIVNGVPMRDAIVLVEEAGQWKILRIFG